MHKSFLYIIAALGVAMLILALYARNQFYGNAVTETFMVSIDNEDSSSERWSEIEAQILPNIKHDMAFKFYAKHLNLKSTIKSGRYQFDPSMSVIRIVRMLKLGEQISIKVTFNNVRTLPELAGKVASQLNIDSLELLTYLKDEKNVKPYGFDTVTIFSMFIPNTYQFHWNTSPKNFVDRMHYEHNAFWNKERVAQAAAMNLSRLEVMTLASIVYEETKRVSEMSRIAGVYTNRLRIGMPLQADPTVKYALQDFTLKRILYRHLKFESPYNTYINKGLPPSPIAMPSIAAIDASLNAEKHSYIYFCARATLDGYHSFATTLDEHNQNAQAYINELNRLKIK